MAASIAADVSRRVLRIQQAVERGRTDAVKKSAEKAKAEQLAVMRVDSGGDLMLSGVGKARGRTGNAKLNVTYRVRSSGMTTTALIRAIGPLQIINNDTSGHVIRSAYSTNTRSRNRVRGTSSRGFVGPVLPGQFGGGRRAVLRLPDGSFRRSVRHPGTEGKDTWRRGRAKAEPKVATEMHNSMTKVIAKGMAG